jgi:hypothetical protein
MGKSHHYVPQLYLRNFSCDVARKLVNVFNTKDERHYVLASIKDQACRDHFYDDDGKTEQLLGSYETTFGVKIKDVLNRSQEVDISWLSFFVVLTYIRTQKNSEFPCAIATELARHVAYSLAPQYIRERFDKISFNITLPGYVALKSINEFCQAIEDLTFGILINDTGREFITSDNPTSSYNKFLESRKMNMDMYGAELAGAFFHTPISPTVSIILYDKYVYDIGLKRNGHYFNLVYKDDVDSLNSLQAARCGKVLFYKSQHMARRIDKYNAKCKIYRTHYKPMLVAADLNQPDTKTTCGMDDKETLLKILRSRERDIRFAPSSACLHLNFRFMKIRRELHHSVFAQPPLRRYQMERLHAKHVPFHPETPETDRS